MLYNFIKYNSRGKRVKEKQARLFKNILNLDRVTGKDMEKNEKVCDTLKVKEDLFFKKELVIVLNQ